MIHTGDCIEVMSTLPADSVDAIVTDPPYGLEFMGKEWDRFAGYVSKGDGKGGAAGMNLPRQRYRNVKCPDCNKWAYDHPGRLCECGGIYRAQHNAFQAWCEAWGREALRVTKPGGYLLAFGGTRTHHRLVCGLEDAGWIIRDELDWIYASGFPKGKANLKPAHEPIVLARKPGPLRPLAIDECRIGYSDAEVDEGPEIEPCEEVPHDPHYDERGTCPGYPVKRKAGKVNFKAKQNQSAQSAINIGGAKPGDTVQLFKPGGRWPSNLLLSDPALFDERNAEVVGSGATMVSTGGVNNRGMRGEGWDRPSHQDWVPSASAGGFGDSGGYSRFFIVPKADRADREPVVRGQLTPAISGIGHAAGENGLEHDDFIHPAPEGIGAWLREQREAAGLQQKQVAAHFPSKTGGLTGCVANWELECNRPTPDQWRTLREVIGFDDLYDEVMTATHQVPLVRFKPNGKEQPVVRRENAHPTVKPVDLMRHLVRLVTPQGGTVLDCFLGSGSTALACELEGFAWIGIEKEPEYVAIAEARLHYTQKGLGI